ncbi:MAG: DUF1700 domain-containing protein [Clostridia bacterium]|nr:DUF1700 domain-containing protein [Clostridia bacterium]
MTRVEFLAELKNRLISFEESEVENWLKYYSEIIDDRIEDGQTEESAVASLGDLNTIIDEILQQTPITRLAKAKLNRKTLRGWEIALLIIGFPLWFPLLMAVIAVILALYVALGSVIISFWASFGMTIAGGIGGIISGIVFSFGSQPLSGVALIGAGIACIGFSILLFYGSKAITEGTVWLTKKIVLGIKNSFIKKEEAK